MIDFDRSSVDWTTSPGLIDYPVSVAAMEDRIADIRARQRPELVWLLEHHSIYTSGTSARAEDLRDPRRLPVHRTGRGGQYTYHGPGQRIAYVMLDVQSRFRGDVRAFVGTLEAWIVATLAEFGIRGEVRPGRVGVWVSDDRGERKIAAIGIRIRRGVSYHGVSLNIAPDLSHYDGIVPCGIAEHGVTSFAELGIRASIKDVDMSLRRTFEAAFRVPTRTSEAPGGDARAS